MQMTYYGERERVYWANLLDGAGEAILQSLGIDPTYLDFHRLGGSNPIVEALKDPNWVSRMEQQFGRMFNRTSLTKLATICQMVVFDSQGGPEGDGKPKALRRHWYQWFKVDFALPFSIQLGEDPDDPRWGLNWAGRMSTIYGGLVDDGEVTYLDLWIEDASRMMKHLEQRLFHKANIVVAVEKDSLFADFEEAASRLGAACLISGKGKNSKAATEKMLRETFGWTSRGIYNYNTGEYDPVFTDENPLYVIHISDHDYDGESVIGPTFGEQARRYTEHVYEARVGISPYQMGRKGYRLQEKMYQIKLSNKGYVDWAKRQALFVRTCTECGQQTIEQSSRDVASACCAAPYVTVTLNGKGTVGERAYLLKILDFDFIVERLRIETEADAWDATYRIQQAILAENESYQKLLEEFERLERIKRDFESEIETEILEPADEHKGDFWEEGDDPEEGEFIGHVDSNAWGPWRPFNTGDRTNLLIEFLEEDQEDLIQRFKEQELEF
jgi:hypothetical protein